MPKSCSIVWPNGCTSCVSKGRETDYPCLCSCAVGHSEGAERLDEKRGILSWVDKIALASFFPPPLKLLLCGVENLSTSKSKLGFVRRKKG